MMLFGGARFGGYKRDGATKKVNVCLASQPIVCFVGAIDVIVGAMNAMQTSTTPRASKSLPVSVDIFYHHALFRRSINPLPGGGL